MENNSGETQARFLAKSLAFLAISSQQTAFGQRELTANEKDGHHRFAQMNAGKGSQYTVRAALDRQKLLR